MSKSLEKLTRHHILPKSRGGRVSKNITLVSQGEHRDYSKKELIVVLCKKCHVNIHKEVERNG